MALFGKRTKEEKGGAAPASTGGTVPSVSKDPGSVILRPRVTEKAAIMTEQGAYAFDVRQDATKQDVSRAVLKLFNVQPAKVRIARIVRKRVVTRGTGVEGKTAGGKKAYVYLRKGDKIELV